MFELRFDMLVAGRAGAGGSFEGSLGGALLLPMLEGFMTIMRHGATSRHSLMHCIRGIRVDSSFVDRSLQRLDMSIRVRVRVSLG